MMKKRQIFISYSHKDEAWKDRLIPHLQVLEKENFYRMWHDRGIGDGTDWEEQIRTAILEAQAAVLLVSADFLVSDFINRVEVPLIREQQKKGLRVFPVIVKPCAWQEVSWLSSMQLSSKDGKPLSVRGSHKIDEELAALTRKIGNLFKKNKTTFTPLPPEAVDTVKLPITGPELFGREDELEILDAAWADDSIRVQTVVAWGGVGKTALINGWLNRMA
ncbi:MAG: toll/interleukin-1 receptor domain-containing protein, partial [Candidatus Aminicenantes bacterium]|nr:toll/interleukin-1 receptor domain-containing protein [Candidatus Aminicenantes bacterium]